MDIPRALELLKQYLGELEYLRTLHYKNEERWLWKNKVNVVLEAAFGKDSDEYKHLNPSIFIGGIGASEAEEQRQYLADLDYYATSIKKILQKYEILGVETELEAKVEPPDIIKDFEEKAGKELELTLAGTPDMLLAPMSNVVKNLNSQGYKYGFRRTSGKPDYTNWDKTYFASYAISQGTEGQIGTISFQLIPNDRTLLKSTQPENWNPSFQYFMNYLLTEFQRLDFADFKKEKPAAIAEQLPKAFISHGKKSEALTKLQQFLSALGIEPIIVEAQPSLGKTVDDKVNYYLDRSDLVVILATGDDTIEGKLHPRQNVIHEIGLAQNKHAEKIIYLLEEGAQFPSNINPMVWERFNQENMENVFLRIIIELRAFGILRAVKP